jgi:hypothetical protein
MLGGSGCRCAGPAASLAPTAERWLPSPRALCPNSGGSQRTVVVAVIAVLVMKVATDAVVDMIPVRNCLMTAARAVDMARVVTAAAVVRRAAVGVFARDVDYVLVDMTLVRVVEVTIVQIVDMAAVAYGWVAATRAMLVGMVGVVGAEQVVMGYYPFRVQDPRTLRCGSRPRGRWRCVPKAKRARRLACRRRVWPRAAA